LSRFTAKKAGRATRRTTDTFKPSACFSYLLYVCAGGMRGELPEESMPESDLMNAWRYGDSLAVGDQLYNQMSDAHRVRWAARVPAHCCTQYKPVREIEAVLDLAADPERWREAHSAFSEVPARTLQWDGSQPRPRVYGWLLYVSEIAAKVIYNASGESAPFDKNSGARLVKNARTHGGSSRLAGV
jgi:hypothetical protein